LARKTRLICGNRPGTNRKRHPKRRPRAGYDGDSYRRAIYRACDKTFPPPEPLCRKVAPDGKRETLKAWNARLTKEQRAELKTWQKEHRWHRLFADHVAASETFVRTEDHGRSVWEWSIRPSKPDNHWFDCLVGCAVAASMCGVRYGVEPGDRDIKTEPIRLSKLMEARR
jgi:hypothetical protein